jgi:hypothetical protein
VKLIIAQQPIMYGLQVTSPGATSYFSFQSVNSLSCNGNIISNNLPNPSFNGFITGISGSCDELFYPGFQNGSKGILKYNVLTGQPSFQNIISTFPSTYPIEFEYNSLTGKLISFSYNMTNHLYYSEINLNTGSETVLYEISDTVLNGSGGGGQFNNYLTFDKTNNIIYQLFGFNQLVKYDITNQTFERLNAQQFGANMYFYYNIFYDESENCIYGIGYNPSSVYALLKLDLSTNQFSLVSEINEDLSSLNYTTYSDTHKLYTISLQTETDSNYIVTYNVSTGTNTSCSFGELDPPMIYLECQPLNLENVIQKQGINVYPNPVSEELIIGNDPTVNCLVVLTDASGKVIFSDVNISKIDFNKYQRGVYFITISSELGVYNHKLIKE